MFFHRSSQVQTGIYGDHKPSITFKMFQFKSTSGCKSWCLTTCFRREVIVHVLHPPIPSIAHWYFRLACSWQGWMPRRTRDSYVRWSRSKSCTIDNALTAICSFDADAICSSSSTSANIWQPFDVAFAPDFVPRSAGLDAKLVFLRKIYPCASF